MPYSLKVPTWMIQCTEWPEGRGAGVGLLGDHTTLAERVYGPLDHNSGLVAFAYLWRRFGPPWLGSDPDKDLVQYILGTPHPEVWLSLYPRGSDLGYSVGYLVSTALSQRWRAPISAWENAFAQWWWETHTTAEEQAAVDGDTEAARRATQALSQRFWKDRCARPLIEEAKTVLGPYPDQHRSDTNNPEVMEALVAALEELRRPVWIRDIPITILGNMRPEDEAWVALHGLKDAEPAEESRYAGYGIPQDAMEHSMKEDES